MASLKDVQNKISAVKKTKQITRAMNMVAASKLRGAQTDMEGFRPYADKFAEVLGSLAAKTSEEASPLLVPRDEVKNVHIVLMTSDRGLCGGFNTNLNTLARKFMEERPGVEFSFTCFGKKGRDWCRKRKMNIVDEYLGIIGGKADFNTASISGKKFIDAFVEETYDEVHVVYSRFISVARQNPTVKQILPIPSLETETESPEESESEKKYLAEHICEPSPNELLGEMLPRNVYVQLFNAILETSTSEHAARMMAMDNATTACNDMIENLTLVYNKARQAAITAELMDIVGGAEALRG
jgi:F-type H+-transporting ATPase subunit gamma